LLDRHRVTATLETGAGREVLADNDEARLDLHADLDVAAQGLQTPDLVQVADAAGHGERQRGRRPQRLDRCARHALERSLDLDLGEEETGAVGLEPARPVLRRLAGVMPPSP